MNGTARVVRLVAVVSLLRVTRRTWRKDVRPDYAVRLYAETDDGRKLLVRADQGFSEVIPRGREGDYWRSQSTEALVREALGVLQPDEWLPGDPPVDLYRHWEPVIQALASHGVHETGSSLGEVPCAAELDPGLAALLSD